MRALLLSLCMLGCGDDFEEPAAVPWTYETWLEAEDAHEMWHPYGAKIGCEWLDDLHVHCSVRGQSWLALLSATQLRIDGQYVDGYASYSTQRMWVWVDRPADRTLTWAHEMGHALMPRAGQSPTKGHTSTGIMHPAALPEWTPEVLELCRREGACRDE